jgi:hypothetical protein
MLKNISLKRIEKQIRMVSLNLRALFKRCMYVLAQASDLSRDPSDPKLNHFGLSKQNVNRIRIILRNE